MPIREAEMLYFGYNLKERKALRRAGFIILEVGDFIPGVHCKGNHPFKESWSCKNICFNTGGISEFVNILPCYFTTEPDEDKIFKEAMHKKIDSIFKK